MSKLTPEMETELLMRAEAAKQKMREHGIFQMELAQRLGVSVSTVYKWLGLKCSPFNMERLEAALAQSISEKDKNCEDKYKSRVAANPKDPQKTQVIREKLKEIQDQIKSKRDKCLGCVWKKCVGNSRYVCAFPNCVMRKPGGEKRDGGIDKYFTL